MGQKDLVLRTYLSDEKRFADLFNTYLGEREIFPEFLRELESVRIRKDEEAQKVKRVEHDLLKIYEKKDKYYILGIQNQEKIDYQMIIRCMAYELEEYERQIRELQKEHQMRGDLIAEEYLSGIKKEDKIIPVAVLLVYFGEEAWDGARELYEFFGDKEDFLIGQMVTSVKLNLLDVQRFKRVDQFETDLRQVFGFMQRRSDKRRVGEDNLAELMKRLIGEDRMKDLKKALENKKYRKKLYREFGIE